MKNILLVLILSAAQMAFAKTKVIEFNQLIATQAKSQNETHSAIAKEISTASLIEDAPGDSNRIVIPSQQVHIDSPQREAPKKVRLSTNEQLEEHDFNRLDRELGSAN